MAITSTYMTTTIGSIENLHSRFANEFCNMLKRHLGKKPVLDKMNSVNKAVGFILLRLNEYTAYGDTTLNNDANNLTEDEMMTLINWCYRTMNKYMNEIYIPANPNIYQ